MLRFLSIILYCDAASRRAWAIFSRLCCWFSWIKVSLSFSCVRLRNRNWPQNCRSSFVRSWIILLRSVLVLQSMYFWRFILIIIRNLRLPMLLYDFLSRPQRTSKGPKPEISFSVLVETSFVIMGGEICSFAELLCSVRCIMVFNLWAYSMCEHMVTK